MQTEYHIRVKEEYASSLIDGLLKMDAVEIIPDNEADDIPQWQKDEVMRRVAYYEKNPHELISQEDFFKFLNKD